MKHCKKFTSPQNSIVEEIMLQIKHVKNKEDNDETQEIEPDLVVDSAVRTPRVGRLFVYLIRLHGISANLSSVIVIVLIAQIVGVVLVVVP